MSKKYEARINGLIQSHLTTLIETQLNDPRVVGITVTDIEVTPDTKYAKVFYSVLGSDADKASAAIGLDSASGWLSRELGRRLRTKNTPQIRFMYDHSLERGEKMSALLDEIKVRDAELAQAHPENNVATEETRPETKDEKPATAD